VLLVDDDSLNLFVLQSYLKSINLRGDEVGSEDNRVGV